MSNPEELNCIICFDIFSEPVTLICGHSFCKDCIIQSLSQVPKCPLCKYPILGIFDFRVNIVLQKMIDKYRTSDEQQPLNEDLKTDIDDDFKIEENPIDAPRTTRINRSIDINANAVRAPAFEIINNKKYCFKNTLYKLEIDYKLPFDLIATIIPGSIFVGYVTENLIYRTRANLFELVNINKPTSKGLEIIARCKDIIMITDLQYLNLHENEEFIRQHNLQARNNIVIKYVNGFKFELEVEDLTQNDIAILKDVNKKITHFLSVLKIKNPQIFDLLKVRLKFGFVNNVITYHPDQNLFEYVNFCAALLDLSEKERKAIYDSNDLKFSIIVIHDYLKHTTPDNDPIFIFNHTESDPFNKQWLLILLVAFLALALRSWIK